MQPSPQLCPYLKINYYPTMLKRLAIISTHPIQYNAPLFAMLEARGRIKVKVFYTWGEEVLQKKYDPGFKKNIEWDIPLLEGYEYAFVKNIARNKGSHHFMGIDNPTLINEIKHWEADAVLVYGWCFKSHLKAMRYFFGKIPVLFRGDSVSLNEVPFYKKWMRQVFLKWVYKHVNMALYVGTHNKAYYCENGLKDKQLIFVPHSIDNKRFRQTVENSRDVIGGWKKEMGISEEAIVFLYAGKLDENKNVGMLAEVFSRLQGKNQHLIIAGNGVTETALKQQYQHHPQIHFLPFQNQTRMPLLYGMADVYVLASHSETWGLALNEAMACSKALLVSNACGAAIDLVQDEKNGWIFKSRDLNDLLEKMKWMGADKKSLAAMGVQSAAIIHNWSYEEGAEKIEAILINKSQQVKYN